MQASVNLPVFIRCCRVRPWRARAPLGIGIVGPDAEGVGSRKRRSPCHLHFPQLAASLRTLHGLTCKTITNFQLLAILSKLEIDFIFAYFKSGLFGNLAPLGGVGTEGSGRGRLSTACSGSSGQETLRKQQAPPGKKTGYQGTDDEWAGSSYRAYKVEQQGSVPSHGCRWIGS